MFSLSCAKCYKTFQRHWIRREPKVNRQKRVTSECEDRKLIRKSLKNRKKMFFELAVIMSLEIRHSLSARTVRRKLGEAGLKGCKVRMPYIRYIKIPNI